MLDIEGFGVPVKLRLELCSVVGLDDVDAERQPLPDLIEELIPQPGLPAA